MLEIEDLKTNFNTYDGVIKALDGVNLKINDGEIFGLVGETGSGKSVTCYSALKLLPKTGEVVAGKVTLNGEDITNASEARLQQIRGGEIGIIFQDPLSALNPVMTINEQIGEILILHQDSEIKKLASLPSMDIIRTKILGLNSSPLNKIVTILNEPSSKIVRLLDSKNNKQNN